jgi:hypothetical protein
LDETAPLAPAFKTVNENNEWYKNHPDFLTTVFENGEMKRVWTLDEIRENAEL